MEEYLDESDLAGEIRLCFDSPLYAGKVIALVEGVSDQRFFKSLIKNASIKIEPSDGKKSLLSVMRTLLPEYSNRLFGICDADQDHLMGKVHERKSASILVTDHHDLEVMTMNSGALESVLDEHLKVELDDFLNVDVRQSIFEAAYFLGIIRWISYENSLSLRFKSLRHIEFISFDGSCFSVDEEVLLDSLLTRSTNKPAYVTNDYLKSKIDEYLQKDGCVLQVCCGHDLSQILSIMLRNRDISHTPQITSVDIESDLRIAYQYDHFLQTQLYDDLSDKFSSLGIGPLIPE